MRKKAKAISIVILCIVAFVIFTGCFGEKEQGGNVSLSTEYDIEFDNMIGNNVYGTVINQGNATAHKVYVYITFNDTNNVILHDIRILLGDLSPSKRKSFRYYWPDRSKADVKVRAYSSEVP